MLQERLQRLNEELAHLEVRIEEHEQTRRRLLAERDDLKQAVAQSGGDRMEQLQRAIDEWRVRQDRRRKRADEYADVVRRLELDAVVDAGRIFG